MHDGSLIIENDPSRLLFGRLDLERTFLRDVQVKSDQILALSSTGKLRGYQQIDKTESEQSAGKLDPLAFVVDKLWASRITRDYEGNQYNNDGIERKGQEDRDGKFSQDYYQTVNLWLSYINDNQKWIQKNETLDIDYESQSAPNNAPLNYHHASSFDNLWLRSSGELSSKPSVSLKRWLLPHQSVDGNLRAIPAKMVTS